MRIPLSWPSDYILNEVFFIRFHSFPFDQDLFSKALLMKSQFFWCVVVLSLGVPGRTFSGCHVPCHREGVPVGNHQGHIE